MENQQNVKLQKSDSERWKYNIFFSEKLTEEIENTEPSISVRAYGKVIKFLSKKNIKNLQKQRVDDTSVSFSLFKEDFLNEANYTFEEILEMGFGSIDEWYESRSEEFTTIMNNMDIFMQPVSIEKLTN